MDEKSPLCGMTFVSKVHTHAALREDLKQMCPFRVCGALHTTYVVVFDIVSRGAAEQHATYLCNAELGAHNSIGVCVCTTLVMAFYALINLLNFFDCLLYGNGERHEELKKKRERKNKVFYFFVPF